MKKFILFFICILFLTISCDNVTEDAFEDYATEDAFTDRSSLSSDIGGSSSGGTTGNGGQPGLITAGEWNDLNNWSFWSNLFNEQDFSKMPDYWSIYTNNRIAVLVENNGAPVINAKVELLRNNSVIWTSTTDNLGSTGFFVGGFQKEETIDVNTLSIKVNGTPTNKDITLYENGINKIEINNSTNNSNKVELSFIVDATGSMGDELEFLKADLQSVIENVAKENTSLSIATSTVFYRDEGDEYITKKSDFTSNLSESIAFIRKQNAGGGGDFPEAVHSALDVAINELQWTENARTKIAFLLLDAPPHYETNVIANLKQTIEKASEKGIKIIPVTASGIDKETEFLMRKMAILTNGTYVFITNDSGIGNNHIQASVGEYQIEKLNDLFIRLIKKYSK